MELNSSFDKSVNKVINLRPDLTNWFKKNQDELVEYKFTRGGCLKAGVSEWSDDKKALNKMASSALLWLENPLISTYSKKVRAYNAALCIAKIYEIEYENLSEEAKVAYSIDFDENLDKPKRYY